VATQETKKLVRLAGFLLAETIKSDLRGIMENPEMGTLHIGLNRAIKDGEVNSFTDLHEIMDANTLGESEKVLEVMHADIPPEGDEAKVQLGLDVLNEAQAMVDMWIRNGGLKQEKEEAR